MTEEREKQKSFALTVWREKEYRIVAKWHKEVPSRGSWLVKPAHRELFFERLEGLDAMGVERWQNVSIEPRMGGFARAIVEALCRNLEVAEDYETATSDGYLKLHR